MDVFCLLENSTMTRAFRGRRPVGAPTLATLSDPELSAHIASRVTAAGARAALIAIGPR